MLHGTLLRLPYFWDEGGYYVPAALDFYRHGWLIPHFTNAHPPLPNVILGTAWHVFGCRIVVTRLVVCAVAAAALVAVLRLAQSLLESPSAALAATALVAVYPIWYVQSSLAHADIFSAVFVLWAFVACAEGRRASAQGAWRAAALFSLAALAKETAIVQPLALAALFAAIWLRTRAQEHLRWLAAMLFPVLPLAAWFGYHRWRTGFTFGNPEYLRYNATANLTLGHIWTSMRYRAVHLFWQRNIWLPLLLAAACLLLAKSHRGIERRYALAIAWLVAANWIAFSVLGGALLTRYLLPVYALLILGCVGVWRARTALWPALAVLTAAAFVSAWWIDPPTSFAPEDTLTYRDMIVVHQDALTYVAGHYPEARVLTAWPVAADMFRPELGYVTQPVPGTSIEDFTRPSIEKAAKEPEEFDTAIVFTTHYIAPALRHYLERNPASARGREFAATRDLEPAEIAAMLGGTVVWQEERRGEWAAVLRFDRGYMAMANPAKPEHSPLSFQRRSAFLLCPRHATL